MTARRFAAGRPHPRPRHYRCLLCDAVTPADQTVAHVYEQHPQFWRDRYGDRKPATT